MRRIGIAAIKGPADGLVAAAALASPAGRRGRGRWRDLAEDDLEIGLARVGRLGRAVLPPRVPERRAVADDAQPNAAAKTKSAESIGSGRSKDRVSDATWIGRERGLNDHDGNLLEQGPQDQLISGDRLLLGGRGAAGHRIAGALQ